MNKKKDPSRPMHGQGPARPMDMPGGWPGPGPVGPGIRPGMGPGTPPMVGPFPPPFPGGIPYPWMHHPQDPWSDPFGEMGLRSYGLWDPDIDSDPQETRETEYWQQMYPDQTRKIQREVAHQCDLLDYEGSVMYDAYPDRIALSRICESVYLALIQNGVLTGDPGKQEQEGALGYEPIGQVDMQQHPAIPTPADRSLQNLIQVLLYQEMMKRRRHRRRRQRSWYMG